MKITDRTLLFQFVKCFFRSILRVLQCLFFCHVDSPLQTGICLQVQCIGLQEVQCNLSASSKYDNLKYIG